MVVFPCLSPEVTASDERVPILGARVSRCQGEARKMSRSPYWKPFIAQGTDRDARGTSSVASQKLKNRACRARLGVLSAEPWLLRATEAEDAYLVARDYGRIES
jgi:hypothetical protein